MSSRSPSPRASTEESETLNMSLMHGTNTISHGMPKMLEPSATYKHTPLSDPSQQIRLLQISNTRSDEGALECSLTTFSIGQTVPYIALSYTWGPAETPKEEKPTVSEHITIGSSSLAVTENLHLALQELKYRANEKDDTSPAEPDSFFWVDAICIDQLDVNERNKQVEIMDLIYSHASDVIVWLGPDLDNSMPIVNTMLVSLGVMFEQLDNLEIVRVQGAMQAIRQHHDIILPVFGLPAVGHRHWDLLMNFYRRSWFSRLWVVQEVALAKRLSVICGRATFTWSQVENASSVLACGLEWLVSVKNVSTDKASVAFSCTNVRGIVTIRDWCVTGEISPHLKEYYRIVTGRVEEDPKTSAPFLLHLTDVFICADPRDKVFAVLGILKRIASSSTILVAADYTHDAAHVFIESTGNILKETNWLGFLCTVNPTEIGSVPNLPSWVPHFEPRLSPMLMMTITDDEDCNFNAPGAYISTQLKPAPDITYEQRNASISFTGCRIATVRGRSENLVDVSHCNVNFEAGIQLILDLSDVYSFTGETRFEAFWRTLVANKFPKDDASQMQQSFVCWWLAFLLISGSKVCNTKNIGFNEYLDTIPNVELLARTAAASDIIPGHESITEARNRIGGDMAFAQALSSSAERFEFALNMLIYQRSLFSTEEGHLGLGYQSLCQGDEVWIAPRAHIPFILRKVPDSPGKSNHYTFVGECYVHGIMHGEHFKDHEPVWEEIVLI